MGQSAQQRRNVSARLAVRLLPGLFLLCMLAGCGPAPVADDLRRLTDAPARMVWVRQVCDGADDVFVLGSRFHLMGFDTEDGRGERVILGKTGCYHKPLFTEDGQRIVFADDTEDAVYVVNWDGSGLQKLSSGLAVEVWTDPDGVEWVYTLPVETAGPAWNCAAPLKRFQLNNPAVEEIVWDQTPMSSDTVQLSRDGAYLCGLFPWPKAGVLDLRSGKHTVLGKGCYPSMDPANSHIMWIFDGPHRNLLFHTADGTRSWTVNLSSAPGVGGHEVYYPRWSNRSRFLCMSGPFRVKIQKGGRDIHVYAGRFNEHLTGVEAWVPLTSGRVSDFYPDLWVAPETGRYNTDYSQPVADAAAAVSENRLTVIGQLLETTPVPTLEEIAPYTQTMVVYRYQVERVIAGEFDKSELLVAHWGIVESRETGLNRRIGEHYRLELAPYASQKQLEGERLIMELSDMSQPLFYDVEGN